jgi:quercetin dioxygenase-like cupin family protein
MKLTAALGVSLLVACSGSAKPATTPPDPGGDTTAAAGSGAATEGDTTVAEAAVAAKPAPVDTGGHSIVPAAKVAYTAMDPKNPEGIQFSMMHGELPKGGAFFLKIPAGMNAGLHTHTADYHAVLVSGAARHWLPGEDKKAKPLAAGSYWFQPGGQPHGDECTGKEPCVLFVVMAGAFDFAPAPKAAKIKPKDKGKYQLTERKNAKFAPLDPTQPDGMKAAFLFGDPKTGPMGMILEVPPGGKAPIHSHTSSYHALILEGAPTHWPAHEKTEGDALEPGSYWFQPGGYDHGDHCTSATPCRAFVFFEQAMDMKPAK